MIFLISVDSSLYCCLGNLHILVSSFPLFFIHHFVAHIEPYFSPVDIVVHFVFCVAAHVRFVIIYQAHFSRCFSAVPN